MRQLRAVLGLLLSLLVIQALGKKDKPDIDKTDFKTRPAFILYFEDSDVVLATNGEEKATYRSSDAGANWAKIGDIAEGEVLEVLRNPFDKQTAVVLGNQRKHWITHDRGESWREFTTDEDPARRQPGIAFHATDPKRMLYRAEGCHSPLCTDSVYYTTDGFKDRPELLGEGLTNCLWAKSTDVFAEKNKDLDDDTILCIREGKFSWFSHNYRAVLTKDFMRTDPIEPTLSNGGTVEGITNIASVKGYLVFAAKSERTSEMAMYVSDDTEVWHRAEFGEHKLEEGAYTLLESTNYSMQVDVMTTSPYSINAMGVLLTSNSNGTFFTKNIEHTNRSPTGFVDFEKMSSIQGIVLVNTVDNWEEAEHRDSVEKEIVSQISFDDGRTWEKLEVDGKRLHLHSVTQQHNLGRVFSSPAPGMVMGVGNTGESLDSYEKGKTYVSDDAGLTWKLALDKPHLFEFGAQGSVLVAVADDETDEVRWSIDHGKTWQKTDLDDKIKPTTLTTTPDSTSLKFMLIARGLKDEHYIYSLDFSGLDQPECKGKDFEDWQARVDDDGEPVCIMGHTQSFRRRKANTECFVANKDFQDPEEKRETCKCLARDFECDYNFKLEDGKCVRSGPIIPPDGACEGDKKTFMGTSGYRLIPGNDCKGGEDLAKEVEHKCDESTTPPASGEIATHQATFDGDEFMEYYYLEREASNSNQDSDETILMRTDRKQLFVTHNHGKTWSRTHEDEEILAIYPHQYLNERVYLITPSKKVYYSTDFAKNFHSFTAPDEPNHAKVQVLSFHPTEKDWLIWTGARDCKSGSTDCMTVAQVSKKGGEEWETLLRAVRKCQFVYREDRDSSDELIYCEQYENENESRDTPKSLISSNDWFVHKTELKRDVINFATMAEYIVVAVRDGEKRDTLKVDTSIDGVTFADAHFPYGMDIPHQHAYTVLDSSTHAVFLHVTENDDEGHEYGSIIKSNSNGTSYVMSVKEVNRNEDGYVDFEKMQGIEGVAVINRVANPNDNGSGKAKKLKTYITHNDGAGWDLLDRPVKVPEGAKWCKGNKDKCSLHLHGYTERKDPRDTYSSGSAVGLMMGTGNVGEYLGSKKDADTFLTRDAGLTWDRVAEGNWMWEYGDQGSIIVIVKEDEKTDYVLYSLDEGANWEKHNLGEEMLVNDISTVPSDTSRNFLLWGRIGSKIATINIDFSGMKERSEQCKLDETNPKADDYDLWSPKHPLMEDNCLFGHVAEYHRKRPDHPCYNGRNVERLHSIASNCSCTREDFECDYNYERDAHGSCLLVKGLKKPDPAAVCKANPDLLEYNEITGYRRIPLTTCAGGTELDSTIKTHPCPDHLDEFKKKHSISGAGLFFAIVLPIAAATGIGYWVFQHWDGKFGRIQLGDSMGGGGYNGAFDGDAPWIKYPVMAISGLVAVLAALPLVVGSLWNTVNTRLGRGGGGYSRPFTSRSSFQRGRGDYSVVDDELLGDDSDEDM